jgi:predicted enzyme related to lactoylglutathione lyase
MGKRTSYPPGTFSWVDLVTPDLAGATAFYAGLLGWEPDGGDGVPALWRLEGDAVAGLSPANGAAPAWTSYVTVDDVEEAAARAREAGGSVPCDVVDAGAGRTALLRDPLGAAFAVWQPRGHIGAERVNDVGCLCMNELVTSDVHAAAGFYERLFGWTTEIAGEGPSMVLNGGNLNAAMFPSPDGVAPYWRACFTVEDAGRAVRRARELGGRALGEPVDIGHGSIAMLADPQGTVFTVFAGETHP